MVSQNELYAKLSARDRKTYDEFEHKRLYPRGLVFEQVIRGRKFFKIVVNGGWVTLNEEQIDVVHEFLNEVRGSNKPEK